MFLKANALQQSANKRLPFESDMAFILSALLLRDDESHDTRDRGPRIVGLAVGFLAASMVVGLLRLGLRIRRRLLSWDDLCIVFALVSRLDRDSLVVY